MALLLWHFCYGIYRNVITLRYRIEAVELTKKLFECCAPSPFQGELKLYLGTTVKMNMGHVPCIQVW